VIRRPAVTSSADYDLVVVGGGAGGITAARTGVRMGRSTLLIQDGPVGGDCTFTGCVPSKTLIEAGRAGVEFGAAMQRVHAAVGHIAATETADALRAEGIEVVEGRARFVGPRTVTAAGRTIRAARMILATGSGPAVPAVPGLDGVAYLTSDTVWGLTSRPQSLVVLGGGAVGCELAQAFARFATVVTVVEQGPRLLPIEEPEARAVISTTFAQSGIDVRLDTSVERVAAAGATGQPLSITLSSGVTLHCSHLLVATGRRPDTGGLDPAAGGVHLDTDGCIRTDARLATSAAGVYAVGDVTGRMLLTHAADEMARLAVRNAFRRYGRPFETAAVPWVTFTDPEVARVGMSEAQAVGGARGARVAHVPMTAVDRAVTAGRTEGFVKLIAGDRRLTGGAGGGRLVGATIVAPHAGEMIHEVALAIRTGMWTGRLAQTVHAYPTWSMAVRQAAGQYFFEVDGRRARPAR
jgi:pyruvate/2-oxoglutarate dehydrogenase complex dihydrolipoamide dehydrogenase (E3) component